jgi:hypothetical protein
MKEPRVIKMRYERESFMPDDGPSIVLAAACFVGIIGAVGVVFILKFGLFR